ncbi:MAG: ComF family protein [Bacteroidales bacterium]|nr:ComF family protein [Bacteroidales bacterium]
MFVKVFSDLYGTFFPRKCVNCGKNLDKTEQEICKNCLNRLPETKFINNHENPVFQKFWGRVNIEFAFSMYYFSKQSVLQYLLHHIKYKGRKELAYVLGKSLGQELKKSARFKDCDLIIPVPLHPEKEKKRGYNQSEWIAKGVSESLNIPENTVLLQRHVNSKSQTRKNRKERWENVRSAFSLKTNKKADYKHVLLIDDVITTGATLEACSALLINELNLKVSVASLAYASD